MIAFVTGATGFVGSHVARELASQGADLRLLVRETSSTKNIDGLHADRVTGDLRDAASLKAAMAGCDCVFHIAADYRLWAPDPAEMYAANVNGTSNLLAAAQECNIRRVVYCSSVATMGFSESSGRKPVTEDDPVALASMIGHYKRSKFMAEQLALEAGRARGNVVIVNPTTPVGECDIKPTPTGRIIVDFLKQDFPAYVDTGLNLVDVKEVAHGHILALDHARPGERYILGGEDLTLKEILDRLSQHTGLPSPRIRVPHALAMAFAYFDEFFTGGIRRKEPRATIEAVRMGKKKMFASSAKAERELNYRMVPVDDALRRAVSWFRANGYA